MKVRALGWNGSETLVLKTTSSAGRNGIGLSPPRSSLPADRIAATLGWIERRVAGHGVVADQAEDHGDVGAVPLAGLGQRAEQVDPDPLDPLEDPQSRHRDEEPLGRPPRPHGVRARRPDADLEDVEGADRLQALIPSNTSRKANVSWTPLAIDIRTNHTIRYSAPRPSSPARLHCSIVASCNNFFKGLKVFYYTTRP